MLELRTQSIAHKISKLTRLLVYLLVYLFRRLYRYSVAFSVIFILFQSVIISEKIILSNIFARYLHFYVFLSCYFFNYPWPSFSVWTNINIFQKIYFVSIYIFVCEYQTLSCFIIIILFTRKIKRTKKIQMFSCISLQVKQVDVLPNMIILFKKFFIFKDMFLLKYKCGKKAWKFIM